MHRLTALLPLALLAACQAAPGAGPAAPAGPPPPPEVLARVPDTLPASALRQVDGCWGYEIDGLAIPVVGQDGEPICAP